MEEIEIRPYKESDWAELARIHDSARLVELEWAGLSNAFLPFSEAAVREHLFDYSVCVALLKGLVCGFAAYSHEELAWLYVDPAHARRGIGKALLQYVDAAHKAPTENRGFRGKCSGFAAVPINGIFICGLVLEKCREMNPSE